MPLLHSCVAANSEMHQLRQVHLLCRTGLRLPCVEGAILSRISASVQVAYCLCAVCRCVAGQLVGPLTLPLALLRDSASAVVQRASSNKSTTSEASATGTAAGAAGSGGDVSHHSAGGTAGQPMARKLLFEMFAAWCEEGTSRGGERAQAVARLTACSIARK